MTTEQDTAAARPATGIDIDPRQLARMRDLVPLSREGLARRTGEILFDYAWFARVLAGQAPADARLARTLWLALECEPREILSGVPAGLARTEVPKWLRGNDGWSLSLDALAGVTAARGISRDELTSAVAQRWFSRDEVNKIENLNPRVRRRPKAGTLAAFCEILDCKPEDLMPGGEPLPEGMTEAHREQLDYNRGMRAFADSRGIRYRMQNDRIRYTPALREAYEEYLAGENALAS